MVTQVGQPDSNRLQQHLFQYRSFEEKKTIEGGFAHSAVRLNEYVRNQSAWTAVEMEERGSLLAHRALEIWPHHNADEELILEEEIRALRSRGAERQPDSIDMGPKATEILFGIRESIRELGESIEIVERKSLCFYSALSAGFFAETLPMSGYVRILLPIDFEEVDAPAKESQVDLSTWKFCPKCSKPRLRRASLMSGSVKDIPKAVAMVRQAFNVVVE